MNKEPCIYGYTVYKDYSARYQQKFSEYNIALVYPIDSIYIIAYNELRQDLPWPITLRVIN